MRTENHITVRRESTSLTDVYTIFSNPAFKIGIRIIGNIFPVRERQGGAGTDQLSL